MTAAERHLAKFVDALAAEHGVGVEWTRMATAVVPFDEGVQELLTRTADGLGLPYVRAMSGAGTTSRSAAIRPTAIVFVAGEHGGISHIPRECSKLAACADGTHVLANAVLQLTSQP